MKRKHIVVLVAVLIPIIIIATCIHYSTTLKKHGYQPESVADFFWQGARWRSDTYMVTQNVVEYPLTEDLTIRCAIERDAPNGDTYSRDWLRASSLLGSYYIETYRDASYGWFHIKVDLDNCCFLSVIEHSDCLILLVESSLLFTDLYGEPIFVHTYGEDYPDQFGNIEYRQYFIVPELKDLPDDYYLSGGPYTITKDDINRGMNQ